MLAVDIQNWGPRPVRMLKCLADFPGYSSFVRDTWSSLQISGWGSFVLKEKLKLLKLALKDWHQRHAQNLPARILSLTDSITSLDLKGESEVLSDEEILELHGLSEELFSLSRANSSICWQQSRSRWLKERDANSKYFHRIMSSKRSRNAIPFFLVNGTLVEGVENVRNAVFTHFRAQFQPTQNQRPSMEGLDFRTLPHHEGASLVRPFTMEEVKAAVWDVDSFKCPGPDGITFGFIKDFWDMLKADVMRFLVEFHRNGRLSKGINSTFIALIPKVDNPHRLNDFRPISLVGSLYKILAKVLANRLRSVIGLVISDSQLAFVKGRQILDGILVANEIVDEARKLHKDLILFKVDFEKMYDTVDWGYLDEVMQKMGFPSLWRKWIKEWCWRLLEDRDSLWFRVLSARYGIDEGRLRGGGRQASEWWRVVHSLSRESWFTDHVTRGVGNGRTTRFWSDVWCGRVSFSVRYSRLFELSAFKGESVLGMSQLGWGEGGEAWRWRRRLFVWEEERVGELILLLANVTLQVNKEDT